MGRFKVRSMPSNRGAGSVLKVLIRGEGTGFDWQNKQDGSENAHETYTLAIIAVGCVLFGVSSVFLGYALRHRLDITFGAYPSTSISALITCVLGFGFGALWQSKRACSFGEALEFKFKMILGLCIYAAFIPALIVIIGLAYLALHPESHGITATVLRSTLLFGLLIFPSVFSGAGFPLQLLPFLAGGKQLVKALICLMLLLSSIGIGLYITNQGLKEKEYSYFQQWSCILIICYAVILRVGAFRLNRDATTSPTHHLPALRGITWIGTIAVLVALYTAGSSSDAPLSESRASSRALILPYYLHPQPAKVLIIGSMDDGDTITNEVALNQHLIQVESPSENRNYQSSENNEVIQAQPRDFFNTTRETFDVIAHVNVINSADSIAQLTRGYFQAAANKLRERGIFSIGIDASSFTETALKRVICTFMEVYPNAGLWEGGYAGQWILIGSMDAIHFDPQRMERELKQDKRKETPLTLAAWQLRGSEWLRQFAEDSTPLTDDSRLVGDNLLYEHSGFSSRPVETLSFKRKATLEFVYLDNEQERQSFLSALEAKQKELNAHARSAAVHSAVEEGLKMLDNGNPEAALECFEYTRKFIPEEEQAPLLAGAALVYISAGRTDVAREYLSRAETLDPDLDLIKTARQRGEPEGHR